MQVSEPTNEASILQNEMNQRSILDLWIHLWIILFYNKKYWMKEIFNVDMFLRNCRMELATPTDSLFRNFFYNMTFRQHLSW